MFREEALSVLAGFHVGPLSWLKLVFGDVGFLEGRKLENRRKPSKQGENHQQTQPAYDTGSEYS